MSKPAQKLVRFDWAMKNILRNKANFDILEGFLTTLLREEIKIESLLESEGNKKRFDEKNNRVDLKCKDSTGREIIIEIQAQYEYDYLQRILFGTSKAIVERVMVGGKYREIPKIISVNILYQSVVPERNKGYIYHGRTEIKNMFDPDEHFSVKFGTDLLPEQGEGVFPEYYLLCVGNFKSERVKRKIDEWMYFFQEAKIEDEFEAPGLKEAEKKLNYLAMPKAEQDAYDRYMDALHYENNSLQTAIDEGEARGKAEGRAEGEAIGLEKGELKAKLETARNLLDMGMSVENAAQATGLSPAEVKKIAKK